ncbi:MAG: hypothetical protein KatS3mg084_0211 [Candidatus Dojkabacteria bacterium]|nr:MAG: hypothetical protein KatS3mg084_0211 [Candidatus Dojkabacteria bacterium]
MEGPYQQPMGNPNEGPERPEGQEGKTQNPTKTQKGTSSALRRQQPDAQRGIKGQRRPKQGTAPGQGIEVLQGQAPDPIETGTSSALRRQQPDAQRDIEGPTNPTAPEVQETEVQGPKGRGGPKGQRQEVQGIEGQGGTEGSGLSVEQRSSEEPRSSEGPRPSEGTGGSEGTNFQIGQSVPPESVWGAKPPLSDQPKRLRPLFYWANRFREGSFLQRLEAQFKAWFGQPFVKGSRILVPRSGSKKIEDWEVISYKGLRLFPWSRRVILAHPNGPEYGTKEMPLGSLVKFNLVMTKLYAEHMNKGVTLPNGEKGVVTGYVYRHESGTIYALVRRDLRYRSEIVAVAVQRVEI